MIEAPFLLRHPALVEKSRCLTWSFRQGRSRIDEQRCRRLFGQSSQQTSIIIEIGGDDQGAFVSRSNVPKQLRDRHWPGIARLAAERQLGARPGGRGQVGFHRFDRFRKNRRFPKFEALGDAKSSLQKRNAAKNRERPRWVSENE